MWESIQYGLSIVVLLVIALLAAAGVFPVYGQMRMWMFQWKEARKRKASR